MKEDTNDSPPSNRQSNRQLRPSDGPLPRGGANPYLKYSGLAFQLIASIVLGAWLGSRLDQWLALKAPAFTIGLSLLFTIGSLVLIIRDLMKEK